MKILKFFSLMFLFVFSASFSLDYPDDFDYTGYLDDTTVSWDDSLPTSFDSDFPEDAKQDILKTQDIVVNIPFFGYIIVSKIEDSSGNKIWKSVPESRQKFVKIGEDITFNDFDLLIDKNKKLTFSASSDIYGTKGKVILSKSKLGPKVSKVINLYGGKFVFDFVNKPSLKPFPGANITADKMELGIDRNFLELSADFKDAQVAEFGKIDKGVIKITRQKGEKLTLNITGNGTLDLPEIGQISYKLTTSLNSSGDILLKASTTSDVVYKDLTLKKVKAIFNTKTKELKLKGIMDVLGFYVVVTLKRTANKNWIVTGKINKDVILSVPFFDGRVIDFTNAEFLFDLQNQIKIKAYSKLDITPITLTLIVSKRASAQFEITDSTISQFVPSSQDTQVGNIKIHNVIGKITSGKTKLFQPKTKASRESILADEDFSDIDYSDYDYTEYEATEEGLEFFISASANLSSVVPQMQNLDVLVTVSGGPKTGFFLTADLDNIEFPEFGKISNAKAFISIPSCGLTYKEDKTKKKSGGLGAPLKDDKTKSKTKPCPGLSVGISGTGETDLPQIGHVKYVLSSSITNGALIIRAELGDIRYQGLRIEKASAMFNTKTQDFEIVGYANLLDVNISTNKRSKNIIDQIKIKVTLSRTSSKDITSPKYYLFKGIIESEVQPLKNIPVKLLNGSVFVDKNENNLSFTIAGDIKIEDHILTATTRYKRGSDSEIFSIKTTVFEAGPKAKFWTLSSLSSAFKNTPFEDLHLSSASLTMASDTYTDDVTQEIFTAGITLVGDFDDFLVFGKTSLKNALGDTKSTARVFGTLNLQNIRDSSLGVKFDTMLKDQNSKSQVKSGGLTLAISGKPSVFFIFKIIVDVDPSNEPLGFAFRLDLDAEANVGVSGDMNGCWTNPFKIQGVSVCELGLSLGVNIPQLLASGLPSAFGVKGYIEVPGTAGKKRFIVAFGVNTADSEQNYLVAELEGELTLNEIVGFVFELADGAAKASVKAATGKKLATTGSINLKNIPTLSIKDVLLKIVPPGNSITIGDEIYDPGFTFRGKMNLLGKNALINIQVSEFGASGEGYLEKIEYKDLFLLTGAGPDKKYGTKDDGAYVSLALTPLDQHVAMSSKIAFGKEDFRIFETETNVYISPMEGIKFSRETKLFNSFETSMTVIIPGVEDVLNDKDALLKTSLDIYFKNDFNDLLKKEVEKGLKISEQELQKTADDANKAFDQAKKDILDAKNRTAKQELDKLEKELNDTKAKWNSLSSIEKSYRWTDIGSKIAGLEAAVKVGRETYKPILTFTQEIVDQAARQVSNTVLKGTNVIVQQGGKYVVVKGLLESFTINEVYFHGQVGEIQDGIMPRLKVVVTVTGKKYTMDGRFNFKEIGKSFETLGNTIKDGILKVFKK